MSVSLPEVLLKEKRCWGVAGTKKHTLSLFSCVVWFLPGTKSNNIRCLSPAKEAKILLFVPDRSLSGVFRPF